MLDEKGVFKDVGLSMLTAVSKPLNSPTGNKAVVTFVLRYPPLNSMITIYFITDSLNMCNTSVVAQSKTHNFIE